MCIHYVTSACDFVLQSGPILIFATGAQESFFIYTLMFSSFLQYLRNSLLVLRLLRSHKQTLAQNATETNQFVEVFESCERELFISLIDDTWQLTPRLLLLDGHVCRHRCIGYIQRSYTTCKTYVQAFIHIITKTSTLNQLGSHKFVNKEYELWKLKICE